jgi:hypothetical protein
MKNILRFILLLTIILAIAGCSVNSSTGSITSKNSSDIDATNLKVGKVYIGFVGKGQTVTTYFFTAETAAPISAGGFTTPSGFNGTVDLILNYQYNLDLSKSGTTYSFTCMGLPVGDSSSIKQSDIVWAK